MIRSMKKQDKPEILQLFAFIEKHYPDTVRCKLRAEPENEFAVKCCQKYSCQISPYFLMTK